MTDIYCQLFVVRWCMRADRLIALTLRLQQKGKQTGAELADALGVSQRTIYRDVDALSALGIPVYADGGPGGGYSLLENYRTTLTGLNEGEIRALFALAVPNHLSALSAGGQLDTAFLKLSASLPQKYQDQMVQTEQRLYLDSNPWFQHAPALPHLPTLQHAVWHDQQVSLGYSRQDDSVNQRVVSPYALAAKSGLWYLVADTEAGMRVYRVSRIHHVEALSERFVRSAEFDLPTFWHKWVADYERSLPTYLVTLKATAAAKEPIVQQFGKEVWDSAEFQSGYKHLTISFERKEEAHATLMGMGNTVSVLSPDRLRQLLVETAQAILTNYG